MSHNHSHNSGNETSEKKFVHHNSSELLFL